MPETLVQFAGLLLEPIYFFSNPQKRIFWLYLLSSLLIALSVLAWRGVLLGSAIRKAIDPRIWLNASGRVDLQWIGLNHCLRALLVVPVLGASIPIALTVNRGFIDLLGPGNFFQWGAGITGGVFTAALFLGEDFTRFLLHMLYHRVPWLWRFHAVHHSAESLTPLTLYRIHAVEMFINSCRSLLVIGAVSGIFIYLFDDAIGRLEILGASIFTFAFNMAGANLRHSPIWLGFGRWERWFISPAQHQIHHSDAAQHVDKNYGATLAVWDRWFGSWVASEGELVRSYGLRGKGMAQSLWRQLPGLSTGSPAGEAVNICPRPGES